ncbi:MAG: SPFH domain-containing protein, partial [Firmicutes bacterium]|nr:SPFH domain-containing protein [Candidatus Caballimonas caccae]
MKKVSEAVLQSTAIKNDVLSGAREFLSLDFSDPIESKVALDCVIEKENYVYLLDVNDKAQMNVILSWLKLCKSREEKYVKIFKLLRKQLSKENLDFYLYEKFEEGKDAFDKCLDIYKGFTSNVILSYDYETKEGETLCYFDKALGVPTKLRVNANFKLKIVDSVKLIEKLDVNIASVSLDCIIAMVNNSLNAILRDAILPIIEDENLSYYQLSRNYTLLGNAIISKAKSVLGIAGIEVAEINIRDIAISNNSGKMLEEQYFAIAEEERIKEFENRVEEASLALYERKAMIHEKYPSYPVTLTEAEKDFAFERFLKKQNKGKVYSTKLDEIELEQREKPEKLVKGKEPEILVPKEPLAPKMIRGIVPYAILFALFVIASVITIFLVDKMIGIYALAGSVVVFGVIGIVLFIIVSKNKKKYPSKKEYKSLYTEYQKE